jgi:hypothetical protein
MEEGHHWAHRMLPAAEMRTVGDCHGSRRSVYRVLGMLGTTSSWRLHGERMLKGWHK